MALSGSFSTNAVGNFYFTFEWSRTGYDSNRNEHYINYVLKAHNTAGSYRTVYLKNLYVNGSQVFYNISGTRYYEGDVVASGSATIPSSNDAGDGSFGASFEAGVGTTSGANCSGSGNFTLDRIPRYANITSLTVESKTVNSITLRYRTDRAAWLFVNLNNGQNWLNGGEPFASNTTSGTFTIYYKDRASTEKLDYNTNYTITVLCRAINRDSGLDTSKNINVSTYDVARITEAPNINIGDEHIVKWTNPLNLPSSLKLCALNRIFYKCDGTETGDYYFVYNNINYQFTMPSILENDIIVFDTETLSLTLKGKIITTTTDSSGTFLELTDIIEDFGEVEGNQKEITPVSSDIYPLTPNDNQYTARYIITSSQNSDTYSLYKDFTFSVINSDPVFLDFDYADTNPVTLALTGDSSVLIPNYSTNQITISSSDKAIAQNSATMDRYKVVQGTQSSTVDYSDISSVEVSFPNMQTNEMSVYAIDSRENFTSVIKTLESGVKYLEYTDLIIQSMSTTRGNNGVGKDVTLTFNGVFWHNNFGNVINSVNATYEYKELNAVNWTAGITPLTITQDGYAYSFSGLIVGDLGALGFDESKSFNIRITVNDELSSKTYITTLGPGIPAIAIDDSNGVAIKQKYDKNLGGALQVNGDVYLNGENIQNKVNDLNYDLYNQIEEFEIQLASGYNYVGDEYVNKCYYNKITQQVNFVYAITGTLDNTWRLIGLIDIKYAPPARVFFESTLGVDRALLRIENNGEVYAYTQSSATQIRGVGSYFTSFGSSELDYIRSTGGQYIDTGIKASSKIKVQMKFEMQEYTGSVIFGYRNTEAQCFRLFATNGEFFLDYGSGDGYNRIRGGNFNTNTIYEIELGNRYVKDLEAGTNIISDVAVSAFSYNANLTIFGNDNPSKGILYYCKIYEDDELVRDYIPMKDDDEVVCLYDQVTEQYYYNQGSYSFYAGIEENE